MLLDEQGCVSNRASELVGHAANTGNIVPEYCRAVVEANPPPSVALDQLEVNLLTELRAVRTIADSLGVAEIPLSEVGPGNKARQNLDERRYVLFGETVGASHSQMERSFCGIHLHVDRKDDIVAQYNVLLSMDPVFVLMSSSSVLRGRMSVNCGRVDLFRNRLFRDSPQLSQLLDYITKKEDLDVLERSRSEYFLSRLDSTEENQRIFGGYNNGSSPLRRTPRTIEIRCADSNIPSLAVAMAALYKGVLERVFEVGSLDVLISTFASVWHMNGSEIMLPSHRTLKTLESEGISMGMRSIMVSSYLAYLVSVAEQGLPSNELRYLRPFKVMLEHRRNVADLICEKANVIESGTRGRISKLSAARVNLFFAEQYRDDLAGGSQLLDMISNGLD